MLALHSVKPGAGAGGWGAQGRMHWEFKGKVFVMEGNFLN